MDTLKAVVHEDPLFAAEGGCEVVDDAQEFLASDLNFLRRALTQIHIHDPG